MSDTVRSQTNVEAPARRDTRPRTPVTLVVVPYDSGSRAWRMGLGPPVLADALGDSLETAGHSVDVVTIEATSPTIEIRTAFDLARGVATAVREAIGRNTLPLVLSGNCMSAVGTIAGLDGDAAVIWLDAHGDLNTPDTTLSGFLDGMALATVTGRCWPSLTAQLGGFAAVPDSQVVLVGARDLDDAERELLAQSDIVQLTTGQARTPEASERALAAAVRNRARVYLHVDLDVLDPTVAPANRSAVPDGLTPEEVSAFVKSVRSARPIAAAALTAYDPSSDPTRQTVRAASQIAAAILDAHDRR
jgi:arginase